MSKNDLSKRGNLRLLSLLLSGGAVFSMHFGASSMVWPMNWGKESGSSVWIAFAGAFLTSIFLVLLAYIALSRGEGSYSKLTNRVIGKTFGNFFTVISISILGPLYVIPRMSAAAWESLAQAFNLDPNNRLLLFVFTASFYVICYFFLMNPGQTMDKISKILFPVLIVFVAMIVFKGLTNPIAEPIGKIYDGSAFAYGFTNGYATAEILCALIYGKVIFNTLETKGVAKNKMTSNMIRVGTVGIVLLASTHLCHMLIGASTGTVFSHLNYTALYTAVATRLFGAVGGRLFSITLCFAALTAGIGMTSGCAEFFVDISDKRINYRPVATIILILSTIFGSLGLTNMLSLLSPTLDAIYPATIVMVVHYALVRKPLQHNKLKACRWGMYAAFVLGVIDMLWKYASRLGLGMLIRQYYEAIPLASSSMLWLPFSILVYVIAMLSARRVNISYE